MRDFVYDIETYRNYFCMVLTDCLTGTRFIYEINETKNQSFDILQMMIWCRDNGHRWFGYFSLNFDYPVMHFVAETIEQKGSVTVEEIYMKAQAVIAADWNDWTHSVWPSDRIVKQADLLKIHHFDNFARSTSLKKLEINMQSKLVIDLPYSPHLPLSPEQQAETLVYCCHDVAETLKFYWYSKAQIDFRDELAEKYPDLGDVINFNDTKIGKKYFEMEMEKRVPGSCYEYVDRRKVKRQTLRPVIHLRDVISPKVSFQEPAFQAIKTRLENSTIYETKGVFDDYVARFDGIDFVFGTGGIHASRHNTSVYENAEMALIDVDVASYYPNLAISNRFYPEHLSEAFCDIYKDVYDMRKSYGKKTAENAMLKLALNGVYGDSGNKHSPFFDNQYMMSITVNGQLFLCMLAEWLVNFGCQMVQANTDGVTVLVPRPLIDHFNVVLKYWENHTGLELEQAEYREMHIRDVNNYIAVKTDGSIKRIGDYTYERVSENPFTRERLWHKDHSQLVVPKAAEAYLVHGTDPLTFLRAHDNPFDFMQMIKVNRDCRLELQEVGTENCTQIQNTTRYYVSTVGHNMVKIMPPIKGKTEERRQFVQRGWTVKTVNDADHFDWSTVNYLYYKEEVEKLVKWRL